MFFNVKESKHDDGQKAFGKPWTLVVFVCVCLSLFLSMVIAQAQIYWCVYEVSSVVDVTFVETQLLLRTVPWPEIKKTADLYSLKMTLLHYRAAQSQEFTCYFDCVNKAFWFCNLRPGYSLFVYASLCVSLTAKTLLLKKTCCWKGWKAFFMTNKMNGPFHLLCLGG